VSSTPGQFSEAIQLQTRRWAAIVKAAELRVNGALAGLPVDASHAPPILTADLEQRAGDLPERADAHAVHELGEDVAVLDHDPLELRERGRRLGGVLGAMETGYQRGKIQEESLYYETRKHDGTLPIVGVNTFRNPQPVEAGNTIQLARSTAAEKQNQLKRLRDFQQRHQGDAPAALARLREVALANGNVFAELMNAVRACSLGQITNALFEVGGQYRRNM